VADLSLDANQAQRRRSAALIVAMSALAVGGAVARWPRGGEAPAPCPHPALRDGMLACDGEGEPPGARAWLAGGKLDVNRATRGELEQIPGVGPSLAGAIVEARGARGPFSTLEELDDVPGIGPKTLEKLRSVLDVR
jgi:competence protein ComEA